MEDKSHDNSQKQSKSTASTNKPKISKSMKRRQRKIRVREANRTANSNYCNKKSLKKSQKYLHSNKENECKDEENIEHEDSDWTFVNPENIADNIKFNVGRKVQANGKETGYIYI